MGSLVVICTTERRSDLAEGMQDQLRACQGSGNEALFNLLATAVQPARRLAQGFDPLPHRLLPWGVPQGPRHTPARILATARPTVRVETPSSTAHSA